MKAPFTGAFIVFSGQVGAVAAARLPATASTSRPDGTQA
jgi:hypothetical protein